MIDELSRVDVARDFCKSDKFAIVIANGVNYGERTQKQLRLWEIRSCTAVSHFKLGAGSCVAIAGKAMQPQPIWERQ